MQFNYEGRVFRSVNNSPNGEVCSETLFRYHQQGQIVWATYGGGSIVFGALVAKLEADGSLDMRYEHVNSAGDFMTGECRSIPEVLPDGRYRLHESWKWTCGDHSKGVSVIEEIPK